VCSVLRVLKSLLPKEKPRLRSRRSQACSLRDQSPSPCRLSRIFQQAGRPNRLDSLPLQASPPIVLILPVTLLPTLKLNQPSTPRHSPCLGNIRQALRPCTCWLRERRSACSMYLLPEEFVPSMDDRTLGLLVRGMFREPQSFHFRVHRNPRTLSHRHPPTSRVGVA